MEPLTNRAPQPASSSPERASGTAPAADHGLLRPVPRPAPQRAAQAARYVGPGRKERAYLERLADLETQRQQADAEARASAGELVVARAALETAQQVERGCQRRLDRLEERLDRRELSLERAHQAHKRMAVALGALQRENELLRQRLAALPAPAAKGASLLARLLGRAR
jgi:hypothetical protein